jgi:hypothetical protein
MSKPQPTKPKQQVYLEKLRQYELEQLRKVRKK